MSLIQKIVVDEHGTEYEEWVRAETPEDLDKHIGPVIEPEYEAPTITVTPSVVLSEEEQAVQERIEWAQADFADGAVDMVNGTLQMTKALVRLKEDDRYLQSPLVSHYETKAGWKDYLRELVAWTKEMNPEVQISMSSLQNNLWRHKVLVGHFGFDERLALGAHEQTVRDIRNACQFDYKTGEPIGMKDGFQEDLLPVPPGTEKEDRLNEGMKTIISDALAQPIINRKQFDDYRAGTGKSEVKVGMQVVLDEDGRLVKMTGFVEKFDERGKATQDYAVDLLADVWPCEIADKMLDCGWNVEFEG